jgi:transcriptional regulator with XRE-family HTH domain
MEERPYPGRRRAGWMFRSIRRTLGLTEGELARAAGLSRRTIRRWESGAGSPAISDLLKLCKGYGGMPMGTLLVELGYVPPPKERRAAGFLGGVETYEPLAFKIKRTDSRLRRLAIQSRPIGFQAPSTNREG